MMLLSLFDNEPETSAQPISLRVLPTPDDASDVRIINPHVGGSSDLESCFESIRDESRGLPDLSAADLRAAQREMNLMSIYERYLAPWRTRRMKDGKVKKNTLQKERQSVRCFSMWDMDPARAPAEWPRGIAWKGLPASYLCQKYFEDWIKARLHRGMAIATMDARWNHVRTVMNMLKQMGIVPEVPTIEFAPIERQFHAAYGDPDDDLVPTIYSDDQLVAAYQQMHEPDLRCAWVLGINCGARTVDLFQMRWQRDIRLGARPEVYYTARKTGRRHWVPLHPFTIVQLRRLIYVQRHLDPDEPHGLVFPRLTSARAEDPEKSLPARWRNKRIKIVLAKAGIAVEGDIDKPWQVLRSTCSSRLNNHKPGAGRLVTHGKDADVNSTYYWNHHPTLVDAIASMPMPREFGEV